MATIKRSHLRTSIKIINLSMGKSILRVNQRSLTDFVASLPVPLILKEYKLDDVFPWISKPLHGCHHFTRALKGNSSHLHLSSQQLLLQDALNYKSVDTTIRYRVRMFYVDKSQNGHRLRLILCSNIAIWKHGLENVSFYYNCFFGSHGFLTRMMSLVLLTTFWTDWTT